PPALRDGARLVPRPAGDGLARLDGAPAQDARDAQPAPDPRRHEGRPAALPDPPDHVAQERVDRTLDVARQAPLAAVDPRGRARQPLQAREDLEQLPPGWASQRRGARPAVRQDRLLSMLRRHWPFALVL